MVCQALCLRRRFFEKEKDPIKNNLHQYSETRVSYLLGQVRNLRPKHILSVNCAGGNKEKHVLEETQTEWERDKPFGPITIEEVRMLFCRHYSV